MSKEFSRRDFLIGSGATIISAGIGWFAKDITSDESSRDVKSEEKREVQNLITTLPFDKVAPNVSRILVNNIEKIPAYTDQPLVESEFAYTLDQVQFPVLKPYEMRGLSLNKPSHKVFLKDESLVIFKTNDAKWSQLETLPFAVYTRTGNAEDFSPVERGNYTYLYAIDPAVPLHDKDGNVKDRYSAHFSLIAIHSEKDSPQVINGVAENVFYLVAFRIRENILEPQYSETLIV